MKKIDIDSLLTIKNYSKKLDVTTSYIYKLIKENKMQPVVIDGVQFIDINKGVVSKKSDKSV
jgi:hypothetical protein